MCIRDSSSSSSGNSSSGSSGGGSDDNSGDVAVPGLARGEERRLAIDMNDPFELLPGRTRSETARQPRMQESTVNAILACIAGEQARKEKARLAEMRFEPDQDPLGEGDTPAVFPEVLPAGELGGGNPPEAAFSAAAGDPTYSGCDMEAPAPASDKDPQLSTPSPLGKRPCDVEPVPLNDRDLRESEFRSFWEEARKAELDGHDKTGTFAAIDAIPEGKKVIRMKFVYAWKTNAEGFIVKCKARLVAIG